MLSCAVIHLPIYSGGMKGSVRIFLKTGVMVHVSSDVAELSSLAGTFHSDQSSRQLLSEVWVASETASIAEPAARVLLRPEQQYLLRPPVRNDVKASLHSQHSGPWAPCCGDFLLHAVSAPWHYCMASHSVGTAPLHCHHHAQWKHAYAAHPQKGCCTDSKHP